MSKIKNDDLNFLQKVEVQKSRYPNVNGASGSNQPPLSVQNGSSSSVNPNELIHKISSTGRFTVIFFIIINFYKLFIFLIKFFLDNWRTK